MRAFLKLHRFHSQHSAGVSDVMWYEGKKANSQITMTTHWANWLLGSREKSIDEKMNTKDLQMLIVMMMVATNHGNDDVNEIENFLNYQIN